MVAALAASLIDFVAGLKLGATAAEPGNRFLLEGVTIDSRPDGALEIAIQRFEASSLRLEFGPVTLDVGRLVLNKLVGQVRFGLGRQRLCALEAASVELDGVKLKGLLVPARPSGAGLNAPDAQASGTAAGHPVARAGASSWSLAPLAAANGAIRAEIVDAHLLFDANVTVPIRAGVIDFNDATVEHVGPDSRMGISQLGVYVDAPKGRSYLFEFPSPPLAGVQYERREALLGPWVSDRGKLNLQAFGEALGLFSQDTKGAGFTEQARLLLARTALSGDVRLGDARFCAPGVQADLVGRNEGRNGVQLRSKAVGQGITVEMASLSLRHAVLKWNAMQLGCAELTGQLVVRAGLEGTQVRFAFDLENTKLSGLRFDLEQANGALGPPQAP